MRITSSIAVASSAMPVGVTTFIAKHLAGGTRFRTGGSTLCSKRGLAFGRRADHLVQQHIRGRRLGQQSPAHTAARRFFAALSAQGVTATTAQVSVVMPSLNLRAVADAVGTDTAGNEVVLELKTTQATLAEHARTYYLNCKNRPTLRCDLPNCLYWRHQLQCGFAMLARKATRGLVVVVCTDGAKTYPVEPAACEKARFVGAVEAPADIYAPTLKWPAAADGTLTKALARRGYSRILGHNPTIVQGRHGNAVVLLIRKPKTYARSRASKGHRALARALTTTRPSTAGLLVWLSAAGTWRTETVVPRTPPVL
ncbi:hypothetical protein [Nereida ignava]|uniref:hypothetical protein n=1 Tax=Nereida ignava TaxID=282199 RepID=UPI0030F96841